MPAILETKGLTKTYGGARGIRDVSLTVEEGEIFGFLGPNGAGKTTTIRAATGAAAPDRRASDDRRPRLLVRRGRGEAPRRLPPRRIRLRPGTDRRADPGLPRQFARRGGRGLPAALVERLALDLGKRFREYSRGNKQKVGLVQAFMRRPRLLILDEPTGGLDPLNQQTSTRWSARRSEAGATIFLSSHILPEVEHLCQRVGIIREGQVGDGRSGRGAGGSETAHRRTDLPGEATILLPSPLCPARTISSNCLMTAQSA